MKPYTLIGMAIGLGLCVVVLLVTQIFGECRRVSTDTNADGSVDLVDLSIQLDTIQKTINILRAQGVDVDIQVTNSDRMLVDLNADGEITIADLSMAMMVTEMLMDHFGYENMSEPLPYE